MSLSAYIHYKRRSTKEVKIGQVPLGNHLPVRIQSMTNTPVKDLDGTVGQAMRIFDAGADYVRITAPSVSDAKNLEEIREKLRSKGYDKPLIADIHFSPDAAEIAAGIVDKIRINPGNYYDKKNKGKTCFTGEEYQHAVNQLKEKFKPLIAVCKEHNTAMRIGVNHGSLSDRIMSRYGDTPEGMAESAMEFLRICHEEEYGQVVISMKSSNTRVMIHACRFLVKMMDEEGMTYPLHLGVTEAGDADEGRIKSAVGIGTLLAEGVGDTIRVSLTEKPENEIQVAKKIIDHFVGRDEHAKIPPVEKYDHDPYHYQRFRTLAVQNIGEEQVPVVIANLCDADAPPSELMQQIGWHKHNDQWRFSSIAADYVYFNPVRSEIEMPDEKAAIVDLKYWNLLEDKNVNCYPMLSASEFLSLKGLSPVMNFIRIEPYELTRPLREKLQKTPTAILVCTSNNLHFPGEIRRMFMQLKKHKVSNPVIIESNYITGDKEEFQVVSSSDTGPLFIDGLGDGLMINNPSQQPEVVNQVSFGILQASRIRTTRTEFIACPGCGRTMFSLENTLQKVKEKTAHLKGLKIAVMGCIVNGPGEMADADYGYVGAGKGKVSLYKNKEVMQRNVPEDEAVDKLIHLIKTSGDWKEE